MSTDRYILPPDLAPLIDREMLRGGFANHGDLLRRALEYWAEHCETVAALNEALDQKEAGRGRPWAEVDEDFRRSFSAGS